MRPHATTRVRPSVVSIRRAGWAVVALAAATLALLLGIGATAAHGHAVLVDTEPLDRSALEAPPERIVLRFNEPVELPPGGLRVHAAAAERVAVEVLDDPDPAVIAAALPVDLPTGGYVVTWRVISADSHPVGGAFTFTVGDAPEVDDAVVAALFGGRTDQLVGAVGSGLRGIGYVGSLLAAGAVAFALLVAGGRADRDRARRLAVPAAAAAVAATLLAIPVQAAAITGDGLATALTSGEGLGTTMTSSFGQGTLVRLVGLGVLLAAWHRRATGPWLVAGAGVALASYLVDGHQRTGEPAWVLVAGDAVHLAGGAVWFAGLVLMAFGLRARSIDDDPTGAARLVSRFSTVALWSVLALSAAGTAMAWALVRVPAGLTTTGYGRTLVVKIALVALVLTVAAYNRWRLVPAIAARAAPAGGSLDVADAERAAARHERRSRAAWSQLRRTVAFEAGGLVAVLLLTGMLVVQQPAADELGVTGAFQTTVSLTDELDLDLVVDPNEVGRNAIHLYVLDATGRPAADVEDLRLELVYADQDIGPFPVEPFSAGPGHWVANVDELRFPGEWQVRVVVGVDRFEEASVTVPVVVNP